MLQVSTSERVDAFSYSATMIDAVIAVIDTVEKVTKDKVDRECKSCGDELRDDEIEWNVLHKLPISMQRHIGPCPKYKVIRMYFKGRIRQRTILSGLSLRQAQAHCENPETSSSTAVGSAARRVTRRVCTEWFDGYERE